MACPMPVSIALQERKRLGAVMHETVLGLVYDPFLDEMWTALKGKPGRRNVSLPKLSPQLKETMLAT